VTREACPSTGKYTILYIENNDVVTWQATNQKVLSECKKLKQYRADVSVLVPGYPSQV